MTFLENVWEIKNIQVRLEIEYFQTLLSLVWKSKFYDTD